MQIVKVDPWDDAGLAAWHAAFREGWAADREWDTTYTLPEIAATFREPPHAHRWEAYAARVADRTVGGVLVFLPLQDNRTLFPFELAVVPGERRRGIGSALYEYVVALARSEGRSSLLVEVAEPYDEDGSSASPGGVAFAERLGFTCRTWDLHRVLDLPVDGARLEDLAQHAAQRQGDYRLRGWVGPCPDDMVKQYVALRGRFMSEVPLGDLDYEDEQWDISRLRAREKLYQAQGRTTFTTVAVAPDGTLVGNTVLTVAGHDPGNVFQDETMVLPEHRGHRLGLALKVANLRAVQEAHPDCRVAHTWNAEENSPMVAVNDALGFRSVERLRQYQRDV